MFRCSYKQLSDEKNVLTASLPPVFCSALSASIRMDFDDDDAPPRFSSLAASILDQRREREIAERREKAAAKNCHQNPLGKKRRRHPAGDIKTAAVDVQSIMEPLVTLRPEDEENVEFKTLLEQVRPNPDDGAEDRVAQPAKKVRLGTKLRKMSSSSLGVKKVVVEDSVDGSFMAGVKTFIHRIFSS